MLVHPHWGTVLEGEKTGPELKKVNGEGAGRKRKASAETSGL